MKKYLIGLLCLMLSAQVSANSILLQGLVNEDDINAFDMSALLTDPIPNPIWGLIAGGSDPNTAAIIPLNFNVFTGETFDVRGEEITVTPLNALNLGDGYVLKTQVGFGIIPDNLFEVVLFDDTDWHVATKIAQVGANSFEFLFQPDFGARVAGTGTEAGMLIADVQVAAVPIPAAAWLFGSSLLGLMGMARRKKA
jgi:hypothetical protein